ncbi:MAG: hypothetical protein C4534_00070 [Gaiellales bacterium]|nr:MAG: hypothetical protein C4534_00070 [Gaiellales bacterium]
MVVLFLAPAFSAQAQAPVPKVYYFNWYDSKPQNGMNGNWIVIGNLEDHQATAAVYFGNESTPRETLTIDAKDRALVTWPNTIGGPVKVVSPGGDTLVVTQRVVYKNSFNEVGAVEESSLDDTYHFTWYDSKPQNGMKGNWILVTNADQQEAQVEIYIGAQKMGSYSVPAGGQITPSFRNTIGGPVKVTSTNGQRLVVSQRVICNDGFNEVMGMPDRELDTVYFFTWYDMKKAWGMKGNWILIANGTGKTLEAEVFIGAGASSRGTYSIGPYQSVTPYYPDLVDGPVRVVCKNCTGSDKIMVSQRILYKDAFEEVQGTPPAGLSAEQYFGWYDLTAQNSMNGNWLLVANQGVGTATVDVFLGTSPTPLDTYSIPEGGRVTRQYPGVMGGPVRVVSRDGQPLMVSQRVIFKESFNELLGLTRQDVGSPVAPDPDLSLYRLNVYWASMADYQANLLSVDMRVANNGLSDGLNTSVTSITATAGVTSATPVPLSLGNVAGGGGYANFTVKYNVPAGVKAFNTAIQSQCQDGGGNWHYFG